MGKKYCVSPDFIPREIAGEYILIPVGEAAIQMPGMMVLNESGKLIWQTLQTGCTREELVGAVMQEYEVDQTTASADVDEILEKMQSMGLLKVQAE